MLKHWFFCKDILKNTQNHKAYVKQKKTEINRKKLYLVWVGTRFKFGCERGRDWFARFGLCRFGVPVWCVPCDSWPCGREMWLTGYWLGCLFWRRRWYGRAERDMDEESKMDLLDFVILWVRVWIVRCDCEDWESGCKESLERRESRVN